MKKLKNIWNNTSKISKIHALLLAIFTIILVLVITKFKYVFGSNIDWMKQHIIFSDYFRNLFYDTKNILPNFSFHLGAGENIFYFAYYGLFSPITFISYLFPYIDMGVYIILSSIFIVIISLLLFYYFLRRNDISNNISFITTLLFLLSGSFLFHSHRHIMFMSYMPFLILSLIGVKRYFDKNKSLLLIFNITLMILTSYYYSIPGLICICLYAIYYYLKITDKIKIKDIINFSIRIILGILLASFLLLPLIYVIINGRDTESIKLINDYFIPKLNIKYLLYGNYSVGLTSISLIAIIYNIIYNKKENKILSILLFIIMLFPIFNLLLNGGLYLNGKVFMPLLPLFLSLISFMIKDIKINKKSLIWLVIGLIACYLILNIEKDRNILIFDIVFTTFILFLYKKFKKDYLFIFIILIGLFTCITNNKLDDLVTIDDYKLRNEYLSYDVYKYINKDSNIIYRYQDDIMKENGINYSYADNDYRTTLYSSTTNINYLNSFYNTFNNNDIYRNEFMLNQTNNLLFNRFMGIKYLLTNNPPYGYNLIQEYDKASLYQSDYTYPIAFSSTHLLSLDDYKKLAFNYKLEAFNNNIITSKTSNPNLDFKSEKITLDYNILTNENIEITKEEDNYIINSKDNGKLILDINNNLNNKTLIINIKMNYKPKCKDGDTSITINKIQNKLTCRSWKYFNNNMTFDYVISNEDTINKLDISFTKGKYDISDINIYTIDNNYFSDFDITALNISKIKDNKLEGTIKQEDDGYFIFTIPYDKGFNIYLDNKKINYEKVNDSFIGFPITKGYHEIKLEFSAPYFELGKVISLTSLLFITIISIYEKKKNSNC